MDRIIKYFPLVLIVFHLIGILLFIWLSVAPELSYLNILMSAILVLLSAKKFEKSFLIFLVIFLCGYAIELIGVQTGWLFGNYIYESSMGPMLYGTPIIIGSTWYAVVVGAVSVSSLIKTGIYIRSLISGLLAVIMDLFIEQVAIKYGLWNWVEDEIPFYNYICWFIFGTLFAFFYLKSNTDNNRTALYLYIIWMLFFSILTLV
jgi:putative membrane protein